MIGLTTAVRLAESGMSVRVLAREMPPDTDSCAAGAMWGPFLTVDPRTASWAAETLSELLKLAREPDETGVRRVRGVEAARNPAQPHDSLVNMEGFAHCRPDELPPGYASGWRYTTAAIDMLAYCGYLQQRLKSAGGTMVTTNVRSLDDLRGTADLVVNCTGSGARELVPDRSVTPMLGRVVVVANPGIDTFFAEAGESPELTWYVPHGKERVVLGSTLESGRVDDPDALRRIVARCSVIEPLLAGQRVLGWRSGFRPVRPLVRVEREHEWLIHNYGHGGSGVSLSWACAREVLTLAGAAS